MSDEVTDGRHLMNPGPRWRSWAENQAERLKRRSGVCTCRHDSGASTDCVVCYPKETK